MLFGFLQLATAYAPKRIFTKNKLKDVAPAKDVPFGVPMTTLNINPCISEKLPFWIPVLTGQFFLPKTALLKSQCSRINRHRSPIKVV